MTNSGVCGYTAGKPVCCNRYHLKNGTCVECTKGYFGSYCTPCTFPSFGYLCRYTCNCSKHLCHNEYGCQEPTTQSVVETSVQPVLSTVRSTIETTGTRHTQAERSSSMLNPTTKTWSVGSFDSTYLAVTSGVATRTSGSMGVPSADTSQTSVIIIVGSLVCFFLILIIGIQIHSKIQKQKSLSKSKKGGNQASLYDSEDIYDDIEDEHVSIVTNKYDIIANRSDAGYNTPKFIDIDASFAPTCSSSNLYLDVINHDYPEIPASEQNSCEPLNHPELSTLDSKQDECEPVHESDSSPTDIRSEINSSNPIDTGSDSSPTDIRSEINSSSPIDTGYLEPTGLMDEKSVISENTPDPSLQHSTYLDVVFLSDA